MAIYGEAARIVKEDGSGEGRKEKEGNEESDNIRKE